MNNTIISPQALYFEIQGIQKTLYDELVSLWNVTLDAYGLTFTVVEEDISKPQSFLNGLDYSGNLVEENNKFFFVKDSDSKRLSQNKYVCDVSIFFILNLKEVKPLIAHRATQEVQQDVMSIIETLSFEKVKGITDTNLSDVLRDFRGLYDSIKNYDMQPYHVFKVNVTMKFNYNNKCN